MSGPSELNQSPDYYAEQAEVLDRYKRAIDVVIDSGEIGPNLEQTIAAILEGDEQGDEE